MLASAALPAHAQSGPEPAAIERTIPKQLPETAASPELTLQRHSPNEVPETRLFTLGAVNIDGATVFSQEELSAAFEPYLASEVDGTELAEIAARITNRYREGGYLLSYATVPKQSVAAGMVRLAVVEGRIGEVVVEGAGSDQNAIHAIVSPVLKAGPLQAATLERAIGLVRDLPGLRIVDVALMRTDAEDGLFALKIKVTPNRVRAFTYLDNRGSDSIGGARLYSSASVSSVAIDGDDYRVDVFGMPGRGFHYLYGKLRASVPIGRSGLRLTLAASKGDQYLNSAEPFDGDSTNLSAQLSYPLLRSRDLTLVAKAAMNDWLSLGEAGGDRRLRDRLRVARLGVEFSNEARTSFQGEFTLSRGLGFEGMTRVGDVLASRPDASGRFTSAALTVQLTRPLSEKVRMQAILTGQYSNRPLLSAEEFSLGGSRVGRAFAFNALTGDRGVGGGVEMSYRVTDSKHRFARLELFAFVDGGFVEQAPSAATRRNRRSLASAGLGTRFTFAGMRASLEAGVPIDSADGSKSVQGYFSILRSF